MVALCTEQLTFALRSVDSTCSWLTGESNGRFRAHYLEPRAAAPTFRAVCYLGTLLTMYVYTNILLRLRSQLTKYLFKYGSLKRPSPSIICHVSLLVLNILQSNRSTELLLRLPGKFCYHMKLDGWMGMLSYLKYVSSVRSSPASFTSEYGFFSEFSAQCL